MPEHLEHQHLAKMPLFPLPGMVFLPHTLLPLHIFEPRYRQMVSWCLENDWPLAVALLPHGVETMGDPMPLPIAGAGDIAHHELLPGGQFRVLLRGLGRVRIVEDVGKVGLVRMVRAESVEDTPISDPSQAAAQIGSLRALIRSLSTAHPEASEALDAVLNGTDDPAVMVDCVGSVLYREPLARQSFLEEPRVGARLDRVVDDLAVLLGKEPIPTPPTEFN